MFYFDKIPPESFTLIAAFLGVLIDTVTTTDERNAMGNFLVSVGQTMLTSAAQAINQEAISKQKDMLSRMNEMCAQLESMKRELVSGNKR